MIVCALQFRPDGTGHCVNTDTIPLQAIGTITPTRASSVEFNHSRQVWEVRFVEQPDRVVFRNASRKACIDWEIKTLNKRILNIET